MKGIPVIQCWLTNVSITIVTSFDLFMFIKKSHFLFTKLYAIKNNHIFVLSWNSVSFACMNYSISWHYLIAHGIIHMLMSLHSHIRYHRLKSQQKHSDSVGVIVCVL